MSLLSFPTVFFIRFSLYYIMFNYLINFQLSFVDCHEYEYVHYYTCIQTVYTGVFVIDAAFSQVRI